VFLGGEPEWTATAAPLCMWLFSLFTLTSVLPACHVKEFVNSPALVSMLYRTGSQATCIVQTSADLPAETNVKCQSTSKIYSLSTFQAGQLFTAKNTSVCRGAKPKSVLQAGPTHMKTFLTCAARPLPAQLFHSIQSSENPGWITSEPRWAVCRLDAVKWLPLRRLVGLGTPQCR